MGADMEDAVKAGDLVEVRTRRRTFRAKVLADSLTYPHFVWVEEHGKSYRALHWRKHCQRIDDSPS